MSPFDSYVDLNPQATLVEGPRASQTAAIPPAGGGRGGSTTSAPARMASLEELSPHASPSSTGAA